MLESASDMRIVGEAMTGEQAIALAEQAPADVVLMDLQMPGLGGIDATRRLAQGHPKLRVLVVTMFEDDGSVFSAMRAGAYGYILKEASRDEILRAIRAVANGEAIFSPTIAKRLLTFFSDPHPDASKQVFPGLTGREREILERIAQGKNNGEIAKELSLSLKTVANYVSNILDKLQVADRAQAIVRARDAGLGRDAR
jgi:DNA-binding NarL/FixJ family response regulator